MIRRGVTINLNDFRSEKFEIEFPVQLLPPGLTDPDAAFHYAWEWVDRRLRQLIEVVVRREASRGNPIDAPIVGPPENLDPPVSVTFPESATEDTPAWE